MGSGSASRAGSCPRVLLRRGLGAKLTPSRQISGAATMTRALSSPLPFPEDATALGLFGPTWPRRSLIRPRCRGGANLGRGDRDGTGQRVTPGRGTEQRGCPGGRRSRTAASIAPEPAGRMEMAPARGGRGRGGGSCTPARVPGCLGTARLPGTPVDPCTCFRGSL